VSHVLIREANLAATHHVLDIGCGCGRIARPLTRYLSGEGRYDGLDLRRPVIEWCRQAYASYPNFHFHVADIRSSRYNPEGHELASTYELPFEDGRFDFVFLGSVFTHMLADGVSNYLREISRVIKHSGLCLATFFLLDPISTSNIEAGLTTPRFAFGFGPDGCRIDVQDIPEAAIAYPEEFIRALYRRNRLAIKVIGHGEWGRGDLRPNMQDAVWATRVDA
jgi:SAM-dependent methyltransferase